MTGRHHASVLPNLDSLTGRRKEKNVSGEPGLETRSSDLEFRLFGWVYTPRVGRVPVKIVKIVKVEGCPFRHEDGNPSEGKVRVVRLGFQFYFITWDC